MSEIETVWLQISSGRGPAECQLAVAKLAAEVERRARVQGLAAETVEVVAGEERGTALSALLKLTGDGASAFARGWSGSVQWICQSPFRPGHKRKNWFVGVEVLGIVEPSAAARIDPRDVAFESMRASGAGGQHVNKTESAVRATHKPTGLVATAREERSQAMNKKLALARLQGLIDSGVRTEQERAERERWQQHDSLERGRPVRIFSGEEFRERRKIFSMSGGEVFRELSPPPLYFRFRSELRRRAFTEYPGYFNVIVSPQDEPRKFSGEYEASNR